MDKTPYTNDDVCAYSYFEVPEIRDYLCNLLSFVMFMLKKNYYQRI